MNNLGHVGVIVKDTEKMKMFYSGLLDLAIDFETEDEDYVQYSVSHCDHKLDLERESLIRADMPGSGYKGVFLRIQTDSLEAIKQLCDSLGGKIVREPVKQDYGKTEMWLEDPEGNLIQAYKDR